MPQAQKIYTTKNVISPAIVSGSLIERQLSEEDKRIIETAMSWPMDAITKRYANDVGISLKKARKHEREIKRFLALCALKHEGSMGMKGPIDEFWHTFIIFTQEYHRFCKATAGRYIHHEPTDPANIKASSKGGYANMLKTYVAVFDEVPPSEVWPTPIGNKSRKELKALGRLGSCGEVPSCRDSGSCDDGGCDSECVPD